MRRWILFVDIEKTTMKIMSCGRWVWFGLVVYLRYNDGGAVVVKESCDSRVTGAYYLFGSLIGQAPL
jgi:hypothetical protein